jgi:hypothetical protein
VLSRIMHLYNRRRVGAFGMGPGWAGPSLLKGIFLIIPNSAGRPIGRQRSDLYVRVHSRTNLQKLKAASVRDLMQAVEREKVTAKLGRGRGVRVRIGCRWENGQVLGKPARFLGRPFQNDRRVSQELLNSMGFASFCAQDVSGPDSPQGRIARRVPIENCPAGDMSSAYCYSRTAKMTPRQQSL